MTSSPVTKFKNKSGAIEYHLDFDSAWDGFDSFVQYLQKHWCAEISESSDGVYSRRWVLRVDGTPVSIYHDSQVGNYFLREDGVFDQRQLEQIEADLMRRMS